MTKEEFYKELKNIGVDTSNPAQMKVWSLALRAMGQECIDHRFDRCMGCHYENSALVGKGKYDMSKCPNRFCPMKEIPMDAGKTVDLLFERNIPLDMGAFYNKYVEPILKELIADEKGEENAGKHSGGNK